MSEYIITRLIQMVFVMGLVSIIIFGMIKMIPGDAALLRLGMEPTPEAIEVWREQMGYNRPLVVQYLDWLTNVLQGDLGTSYTTGQPISRLIMRRLPITLQLAGTATVISLIFSIFFGVISAIRHGSLIDQILRVFSVIGYCIPRFWLAILLMLFFSLRLNWLPTGGHVRFSENYIDNLRYLILPATTLSVGLIAYQIRFLRSCILDVLKEDYVRTARAKGLTERVVVYKHVLRNSLIPLVTVVGINFGMLLSGMVVTEQIFVWPGMGWLTIAAIENRNYEVVMGAVLVASFIFAFINLVVDIIYAFLDPRIHYN